MLFRSGIIAASASIAYFNLTHANTQPIREAVNGANAGTSRDTFVIIGDSTVWGAWSDEIDNTGLYAYSFPHYLAGYLNSQVCPTDDDAHLGCGITTSNADIKKYDPRILGTSWAPGTSALAYALGGYMYRATSAVAGGFQPGNTFDTIQVLFANPASGGSFTIDTGTSTPILETVSNDSGKTTNVPRITSDAVGGSATLMRHVSGSTTAINIMGVRTYTAAAKKLCVMNAGIPGSRSTDWNTDSATYPYNMRAGLATLAPKVLFIQALINDARLGTTINAFKTNIQALIDDQIGRGGGVVLVVGNQRSDNLADPTPTSIALQETYRQALYDLATDNDLPLLDQWIALGSWEYLNSLGYMHDVSHILGTAAHPGNQLVAQSYCDFIQAAVAA